MDQLLNLTIIIPTYDRPAYLNRLLRYYDEQYAKFRECLSRHLREQSHLSIETAGQTVDIAMNAYLKKYYTKRRFGALTTNAGRIMDRLHLPAWLDKAIRILARRLFGIEE